MIRQSSRLPLTAILAPKPRDDRPGISNARLDQWVQMRNYAWKTSRTIEFLDARFTGDLTKS